MGFYDAKSNITKEGIGIRTAKGSVVRNIPVAYTVKNGITRLVFKEEVEETVYTPTGDTYYLYNRGTMSEVLGGFAFESDGTLAYTVEADHLAIRCTKGAVLNGAITSKHIMNLSEYNYVTIEYGFVNASTGVEPSTLDSVFVINGYSTDGDGQYNFIILKSSPVRIGRDEGFWEESYLVIGPTSNTTPISTTDDVILRIYSIVASKAIV